jgi:hypothetical protein
MADAWVWFDMTAHARGGGSYYDHCRYEGCISGIVSAFLILVILGILYVLVALGFSATRRKMVNVDWRPIGHVGWVAIVSLLFMGSMFAGTVAFIFACAALIGLGIGYLRSR